MSYDIAIIGAGPGGYVAAIRAAQLGASVALIEKDSLGGTCLNRGCIPTKAMLASAHIFANIQSAKSFGIDVIDCQLNPTVVYERQKKIVKQMQKGLEQLLKSYSTISIYRGEAVVISPDKISVISETNQELDTRNIIIATGSYCAPLGNIDVDHNLIINSDDALNLMEIPSSILIIGAGAIGIEWSRIFSAFGSDVTLVEMLDRIAPTCDEDLSNLALKLFKKNKVKVKTSVSVVDLNKNDNSVDVTLSNGDKITVDKVLLAVGRRPNTDIKGLENLTPGFNGRYIKVNEKMQTTISHVYAIGDVVGNLPLAHVASHEGIVAVENILGQPVKPVDYTCVPFVIYGHPEIASVGMTEKQAREQTLPVEVNTFYYAANGKAHAEAETTGLIKTVIESETGKVRGVHIIGAGASDIIHQGVLAVKNGLTKEDFSETIFAHPTLSEAFYESIMKLHVPDNSRVSR